MGATRTIALIVALASLPGLASAEPTDDVDQDGTPDAAESELCGRTAVRNLVDNPDVPYRCATSADLQREPSAAVVATVTEAHEVADTDYDHVPDAFEAALCQVENQNDPLDGSCLGDDYSGLSCESGDGVGSSEAATVCVIGNGGPITRLVGLPGLRIHDGWSIQV